MKMHNAIAIGTMALFGIVTLRSSGAVTPAGTTGYAAYDGTYPISDAVDTGSNYANTDYASHGGGDNTYLDFTFSTPETFTQITETDRVTSGGGNNGYIGGTNDFNYGYEYNFYNNPSFSGAPIATIIVNRSKPADADPTTGIVPVADQSEFTTATSIPSVTAQYVQWQVLNAPTSSNNGASNFVFETPEPASLGLIGVAGFGLLARRRRV